MPGRGTMQRRNPRPARRPASYVNHETKLIRMINKLRRPTY